MRVILSALGIFIVAAVVWSLWIRYDTQKFLENPPELPANSANEKVAINDSVSTEVAEVYESEKVEADDSPADIQTIDIKSQEEEKIQDDLEIDNAELQEDVAFVPSNELLEEEEPEDVGPCGEVCGTPTTNIRSLSEKERIELTHQNLVKRFGDIPEVHLFTEQRHLSLEGKTIPQSEILEYVRAVATLFPNEANKRHLKELESHLEKLEMNVVPHSH